MAHAFQTSQEEKSRFIIYGVSFFIGAVLGKLALSIGVIWYSLYH
jgi:hypothetical protein